MEISELYIGAMLLKPTVILEHPVPSEAIHSNLRTFYEFLCSRIMKNESIDERVLYTICHKETWWPGAAVVTDMPLKAVSAHLAGQYAKALIKDYQKKQLRKWLFETQTLVDEGRIDEVLSETEAKLLQLFTMSTELPCQSLEDVTVPWFAGIVEGTEALPRIKTGIKILDDCWLLDKGGLHIIAGRPGMGKTNYALWLTQQALRREIPVLFYSLEMPKRQLLNRFYASMIGKEVTKHDVELVQEYRSMPLYITDRPAQKVENILLTSQLARKHYGIGLVVIDYMQLIRTVRIYRSREEQVGQISQTLKEMAKNLDCPVVCLAQLNRQAEYTSTKRPSLANLRESGSIEQDADSVLFLYRPEYYKHLANEVCPEDQAGLCELIIAKQRNAPVRTMTARWEKRNNTWHDWRVSL